MAVDPHSATTLVWHALVAALMPLRLPDVGSRIGDIVRRIRNYDPNAYVYAPRQLDAFRHTFADAWRNVAA
jgi:hypothetical protein